MFSGRIEALLVASCLLACPALVAAGSSLSSSSFVESQAASALYNHDGDKARTTATIHVDFYTAPSADWSMEAVLSLKALVVRLQGAAIQFNPRFVVIAGRSSPPECRYADDRPPKELREECEMHCMNNGRYCDEAMLLHNHEFVERNENTVKGHDLVEEIARRKCLWKVYGESNVNPKLFFAYHEAMKATGCDTTLTNACVEQAFQAVGVTSVEDFAEVFECMAADDVEGGGLGPRVERENSLLEEEVKNKDVVMAHPLPTLFVEQAENAVDVEAHNNLHAVCRAFPASDKPAVCDFCTSYCLQRDSAKAHAHSNSSAPTTDTNTCLWELTCGDGSTLEDYLHSIGTSSQEIIARVQHQQQQHDNASGGGGLRDFMPYFLGGILTAVALFMTGVGVRRYRNKRMSRIRGRFDSNFLSKQLATINSKKNNKSNQKQHNLKDTSPNASFSTPHYDEDFFPGGEDDEGFVDLELEPGLQYSDLLVAASVASTKEEKRAKSKSKFFGKTKKGSSTSQFFRRSSDKPPAPPGTNWEREREETINFTYC